MCISTTRHRGASSTTGGQESHQLHSMSEANSLILLPDGLGVSAGEQVDVLLIDPDRLGLDTSLALPAPPVNRHQPVDGVAVTAPVPVTLSVRPRRGRPDTESRLTQAMPLEGPLVDRYGRVHDDLRISVTDRCNLRCVYCMPEEGLSFLPKNELLTFDEITRLARVAKSLGVTALRITGGEPLVRKGLPSLIGTPLGARIRRPGHDHQRHGTGQGRRRAGCGRDCAGST